MLAITQDGELDTGPKKARAERFCALTRQVRPTAEMIRFVVDPGGSVVPDLKRNLPGRGLWLTATRQTLEEAMRRQVMPRGFKRAVQVPADLADMTERLLERSALDALAIAGKAGTVATGYSKVEAAVIRRVATALLHAGDGSADGIRKIEALLRRQNSDDEPENTGSVAAINLFTSAQLDLALGRSNVVHAALLAGHASETDIARCLRLERFRTGNPGEHGNATARHQVTRLGTE
jgi:predicted RNA-binding protein YlxR (DUF448 family)